MGKKRNRRKHQMVIQKVRKPNVIQPSTHIKSMIAHSIEILKLKISKSETRKLIALLSRSKDNFTPYVLNLKDLTELIDMRIEEHTTACSKLLKLHLGPQSKLYSIPEKFSLSSSDLKSGYVILSNVADTADHILILEDIESRDILEDLKEGQLLEFDALHPDPRLTYAKSLLANETVIGSILAQKASSLESYRIEEIIRLNKFQCVSATCMDRKKPLLNNL